MESNLAFHFVEGCLVRALRKGEWILIDEVNLASNDVLQRLLPIVEQRASLQLVERGDSATIRRHPDFRLFTCMNPGQEVGKKELPENVRAKFTELFVTDIGRREDLLEFVTEKLASEQKRASAAVVELFLAMRQASASS